MESRIKTVFPLRIPLHGATCTQGLRHAFGLQVVLEEHPSLYTLSSSRWCATFSWYSSILFLYGQQRYFNLEAHLLTEVDSKGKFQNTCLHVYQTSGSQSHVCMYYYFFYFQSSCVTLYCTKNGYVYTSMVVGPVDGTSCGPRHVS